MQTALKENNQTVKAATGQQSTGCRSLQTFTEDRQRQHWEMIAVMTKTKTEIRMELHKTKTSWLEKKTNLQYPISYQHQ
jgi:hypothetical protein